MTMLSIDVITTDLHLFLLSETKFRLPAFDTIVDWTVSNREMIRFDDIS